MFERTFGLVAAALLLLHASAGVMEAGEPRVVLALDRSSSTEGETLDRLLDSAAALVMSLPEGAWFGVIAFHHQSQTIFEPTRLTDANRQQVLDQLRLSADGGTNIIQAAHSAVGLLDEGGHLVLLSDGVHTGEGSDPVPESVWAPQLAEITTRCRNQSITVHTLGVGASVAQDPLLRRLAETTGGRFYAVRKPQDLLDQFVDLTSHLARYWRLAEPGEFELHHATGVVHVSSSSAPHLFRLEGTRRVPLTADQEFSRGQLYAQRFQLPAGRYVFDAGNAEHADLLREMQLDWQLPDHPLIANRRSDFLVGVVPRRSEITLEGLRVELSWQFDENQRLPLHELTAGAASRWVDTVEPPAGATAYRATVDAWQGRWSYHVGHVVGAVELPAPIAVAATASELRFVTQGSARTVEFPLVLAADAAGATLDVRFACSHSQVQVAPASVLLTGGRQTIVLSLTRSATVPGEINFQLAATVKADDATAPRINGDKIATWQVSWEHRQPRLELGPLPERFALQRGKLAFLPLPLRRIDTDADVWLDPVEAASGFSLACYRALSADGDPQTMLAVRPDLDIRPGSHELELAFSATDAAVPLNGNSEPSVQRLTLDVAPVGLEASFVGQPGWEIAAPVRPVVREVRLRVTAVDGGRIPEITVIPSVSTADVVVQPVDVTDDGMARVYSFTATCAEQAVPQVGAIQFHVEGPTVESIAARLPYEVVPSVVEGHVEPMTLETPWWTRLLRWWRRPTATLQPQVKLSGVGSEHASWQLERDAGNGDWQSATAVAGGYPLRLGDRYRIALESAYLPATFVPSRTIPMELTESIDPVPAWVTLVPVAFAAFLVVWAFRHRHRVRVTHAGEMHTARGALRLDRVLGRGLPELTLTRDALHRARRDRSVMTVYVERPDGRTPVEVGESVKVYRDDVVEIESADATYRFEISSGAFYSVEPAVSL